MKRIECLIVWCIVHLLVLDLYSQRMGEEKPPEKDSISILSVSSYDFIYSRTDIGQLDTLRGNVRIIQDSLFMTCDKAIIRDQLYAQATGNIVIIHSDSLVIYADSLFYDGKEKQAELYGEVILEEGGRTLYTHDLIYDVDQKIGTYANGGTLVEKDARLISRQGIYNARQKESRFLFNVQFTDLTKRVLADSLLYEHQLSRLQLLSPTNIFKDTTIIYCESGIYDIEKDIGILSQRVQIRTGQRVISAGLLHYDGDSARYTFFLNPEIVDGDATASSDTIIYNEKKDHLQLIGRARYTTPSEKIVAEYIEYDNRSETYKTIGTSQVKDGDRVLDAHQIQSTTEGVTRASGSVIMRDTLEGYTIWCDLFEVVDSSDYVKAYNVANKPAMAYRLQTDSLYLIADTLESFKTTYLDSVVEYFNAHGNVEFIKSDVAGLADSLSYNRSLEQFTLFRKPLIWSDSTQMSADTVKIILKEKALNNVFLKENALIVSQDRYGHFNQIRGKQINNLFKDEKLEMSLVDGNSEMLYFITDEEDGPIGVNTTISNQMKFSFENDEIKEVRFYRNPESQFLEYEQQADYSPYYLTGFKWLIEKKPNLIAWKKNLHHESKK